MQKKEKPMVQNKNQVQDFLCKEYCNNKSSFWQSNIEVVAKANSHYHFQQFQQNRENDRK